MYCTVADFIAIFGESHALAVTNVEDPDAVAVNVAVLEKSLMEAQAEVDAYLTAYALPLDPFPLVLRGCAADISNYRLHKTLVPEDVRRRYEDRIRFLEKVSSGVIVLTVSPGQTDTAAMGGVARGNRGRFFRDDVVQRYRTGRVQ